MAIHNLTNDELLTELIGAADEAAHLWENWNEADAKRAEEYLGLLRDEALLRLNDAVGWAIRMLQSTQESKAAKEEVE